MTECPTPTKQPFDNSGLASRAVKNRDMKVYRCPCGKWHVAGNSSSRSKGAMKRAKAKQRPRFDVNRLILNEDD